MPALPRPVSRTSPQQRLISVLLVALLHALLLFAVLHFMIVTPNRAIASAPEHLLEMIINTARKPVPVTLPAPRSRTAPALPRRGGVTSGAPPSYAPPLTSPWAPPDVTGLGQALFGCAPENIPNLTPDQRAHCTNGFTRPDNNALVEPQSLVQDPLRREAETRARNTPGRVPCTYMTNAPAPHGSVVAPMLDPVCAVDGLTNGFDPLNGLSK